MVSTETNNLPKLTYLNLPKITFLQLDMASKPKHEVKGSYSQNELNEAVNAIKMGMKV